MPSVPPKVASPETKQHTPGSVNRASVEAVRIPLLRPGETCQEASEALGKPTEEDEYSRSWKKQDFLVTATANSTCRLTSVEVSVAMGHVALTNDGITLGQSTLSDAERILGTRIGEGSESVEAPEGNWVGVVQVGPLPSVPYKITYRAPLPHGEADLMKRDPIFNDFKALPITEYSVEMSDPQIR